MVVIGGLLRNRCRCIVSSLRNPEFFDWWNPRGFFSGGMLTTGAVVFPVRNLDSLLKTLRVVGLSYRNLSLPESCYDDKEPTASTVRSHRNYRSVCSSGLEYNMCLSTLPLVYLLGSCITRPRHTQECLQLSPQAEMVLLCKSPSTISRGCCERNCDTVFCLLS